MKKFAAFGAALGATLALGIGLAFAQQSTVSGVPKSLKLNSLTVGGWVVGGSKVAEKINVTDRTNTTTATDDPDLIVTGLVANATYSVRMSLSAQAGVTTTQGIKINLFFSGTIANGGQCQRTFGQVGTYAAGTTGMNFAGGYAALSTSFDNFEYDCMFRSSTAGNVSVQWAQNTSSANRTSVSGPSFLRVERIG